MLFQENINYLEDWGKLFQEKEIFEPTHAFFVFKKHALGRYEKI